MKQISSNEMKRGPQNSSNMQINMKSMRALNLVDWSFEFTILLTFVTEIQSYNCLLRKISPVAGCSDGSSAGRVFLKASTSFRFFCLDPERPK